MLNNSYEKDYLNWFCYIATNEEVETEIKAIIDREKNVETLEKILNKLSDEIIQINDLISMADEEDKKELLEDKKKLEAKKEIFRNQIDEYNKVRYKEEYLEEFGASGVLFATNSYGNIMIEKDLKWIKNNCEEEVYKSFINLINMLVQNKKGFKETEQKPIQTDNDAIKGLYELKDYQSRIIYRYEKDYIVIIGATIKKTDLDNKYRKFCVNCKVQSEDYIRNINKGLVNVDELIEQSINFFENITNGLGGLS